MLDSEWVKPRVWIPGSLSSILCPSAAPDTPHNGASLMAVCVSVNDCHVEKVF